TPTAPPAPAPAAFGFTVFFLGLPFTTSTSPLKPLAPGEGLPASVDDDGGGGGGGCVDDGDDDAPLRPLPLAAFPLRFSTFSRTLTHSEHTNLNFFRASGGEG
ncbi:unnamed protein product, partial [Ectocarpus sp. 8 AP-2014]